MISERMGKTRNLEEKRENIQGDQVEIGRIDFYCIELGDIDNISNKVSHLIPATFIFWYLFQVHFLVRYYLYGQ